MPARSVSLFVHGSKKVQTAAILLTQRPSALLAAPKAPMLHPDTTAHSSVGGSMLLAFADPAQEAAFKQRYAEQRLQQDEYVLKVRTAGEHNSHACSSCLRGRACTS